jgi:hypothetical protein
MLAIVLTSATFADEPKNSSGPQLVAQGAAQPQAQDPNAIEAPPEPTPLFDNREQAVPQAKATPQAQVVPPAPAPENAPESNAPSAGTPDSAPADARQREAAAANAKAMQLIDEGRFDDAIRQSSRAIALDPSSTADYKRVRASAYLASGRYEEALADSSPLEVTVTAPRAELKTKQTVLGYVDRGTKVFVDDVNGNWLKVIAVGDKTYDWAWINIRNLQTPEPRLTVPRVVEYNPPSYQAQPPVPVPLDRVYYFGPGSPYYNSNYGRDYYDYWQHVPPQYWGYLPY